MIIQLIREALRCSCASNIMLLIYRIVTVRNEVAKVMFLQASVCPQGWGGGVCLSPCWDTTPPGTRHTPWSRHPPPGPDTPPWSRHHPRDDQTPPWPDPPEQTPPWNQTPLSRDPPSPPPPPPTRYGHCCGRYASYWNAFLFNICLLYWYKVDFWQKFFPREWQRWDEI